VARELVLRLDPPMRFSAPPRVVGGEARVSLLQQGARARLRLPAEQRAGEALQVRFEYTNRGPSGPRSPWTSPAPTPPRTGPGTRS
jgi:hypothetical protein